MATSTLFVLTSEPAALGGVPLPTAQSAVRSAEQLPLLLRFAHYIAGRRGLRRSDCPVSDAAVLAWAADPAGARVLELYDGALMALSKVRLLDEEVGEARMRAQMQARR